MKKLLAIVVMLTALMASQAFAQSANANVNLTVNNALSVTSNRVNGLNFGAGVPGGAITVQDIAGALAANAAQFTILGSANTNVTITVTNSGNLTDAPNPSIPWSMTCSYSNAATPAQGTSTDFTLTNPTTQPTNASGNVLIWVGGTVNIPAGTASGQYAGTVTVSVTY